MPVYDECSLPLSKSHPTGSGGHKGHDPGGALLIFDQRAGGTMLARIEMAALRP